MPSVYSDPRSQAPSVWIAFVHACSLHVGAAAAASSLRRDLVERGTISSAVFDEAYAIARLTPGTNLLAMFALLGQHFSGWVGSATAVTIGTVVPGTIAALMTAAYVTYASHPLAERSMEGARAGALAVLLWAGVRLIAPQLQRRKTRGAVIGLVTLLASVGTGMHPIVVLLLAAGAGTIFFKDGE